jgi:hypothetical protein
LKHTIFADRAELLLDVLKIVPAQFRNYIIIFIFEGELTSDESIHQHTAKPDQIFRFESLINILLNVSLIFSKIFTFPVVSVARMAVDKVGISQLHLVLIGTNIKILLQSEVAYFDI